MAPIILDTDVVSFFAKADTRAALYQADMVGHSWCISFQTVAELRLWVLLRRWGKSRQRELDGLQQRFIVLRYDIETAQHWAEITAHRRRLGRPIECGDCWIAAAALRHDLTLLTHNAKDYESIPGLRLISHTS
ncbi:MAG TPA: PIN domain-containing protein [Terriglobales bacterium]|jgi:predicted nucleic acid-binding protein|nr:PIN domain-containing protein [Terriglobales bacterium]